MRLVGFSTGALARSDFRSALEMLSRTSVEAVELSALRLSELEPLTNYCLAADLSRYRFISLHAPARFEDHEEQWVVSLLQKVADLGWPIVLHPDAVHNATLWQNLGSSLLIENMDKRKGFGRTADELESIFDVLSAANLCFDIAHARQVDSSMTEGYRILDRFGDRVRQVHISEVSTSSRHDRMSPTAIAAYRQLAALIPASVPIIIESPVNESEIISELNATRAALDLDFALADWTGA